MTTENINLKSFALAAEEGRTQQPHNIHGAEMMAKLTNDDTDGAVAIFHQSVPPISGPPLHRHSREDLPSLGSSRIRF